MLVGDEVSPLLLAAWLVCQSFDEGTTQYALRHNFHEGNGAMQHARTPIKVSVNIAALLAYRKTRVKAIPWVMAATGCTGGSWNTYQLTRR